MGFAVDKAPDIGEGRRTIRCFRCNRRCVENSKIAFLDASQALKDLTVLDLSRVRSGPTCVRQLADWGANVIKVEMPPTGGDEPGGPREGPDFQNLHRNKRSVTLNMKDARRAARHSCDWPRRPMSWSRTSAPT